MKNFHLSIESAIDRFSWFTTKFVQFETLWGNIVKLRGKNKGRKYVTKRKWNWCRPNSPKQCKSCAAKHQNKFQQKTCIRLRFRFMMGPGQIKDLILCSFLHFGYDFFFHWDWLECCNKCRQFVIYLLKVLYHQLEPGLGPGAWRVSSNDDSLNSVNDSLNIADQSLKWECSEKGLQLLAMQSLTRIFYPIRWIDTTSQNQSHIHSHPPLITWKWIHSTSLHFQNSNNDIELMDVDHCGCRTLKQMGPGITALQTYRCKVQGVFRQSRLDLDCLASDSRERTVQVQILFQVCLRILKFD